jgi:nucleoside-diphosphate-sugar epimerase
VLAQSRNRAIRCLLIGAEGFLGAHLRRELASTVSVELEAIERNGLDLRKPKSIRQLVSSVRPDVIVNVAGLSSPASEDVMELYEVNALGHLHILEAAASLETKPRVVLASSAQLYGPTLKSKATEGTPLNPVSHYGLSKELAEKYCELFAGGVSTVVARIYNAVGRGQSPRFLIPKVVQAFRERAPTLEIGSMAVERDYIDVRDLCAMWRLAMFAPDAPKVVNFSNGETTTLRDIIDRLERITAHRVEFVSTQSNFRKNDIPFQCGDNSTIRKMGYVRRYSLDDTLKWMLQS